MKPKGVNMNWTWNRHSLCYIIASIVFCCGCSGAERHVWIRTAPTEEAKKDIRECKYDVVKYGGKNVTQTGLGRGADTIMDENYVFIKCMETRGYTFVSPTKTVSPVESAKYKIIKNVSKRSDIVSILGEPNNPKTSTESQSLQYPFLTIKAIDSGPLGMDWFPHSRMEITERKVSISFSPDGTVTDISDTVAVNVTP